MRHALAIVFLAFLATTAAAQIDSSSWDTAAIRTTRTEPLTYDVQTSSGSGIVAARLDLAAGGSVTLTPLGNGHFQGTVSAAQALFGYDSTDVNHNFVGYLRLLGSSGQVIVTYNEFVNVIDAQVPAVAVKDRAADARQSPRILNIRRPVPGDPSTEIQLTVRRLYDLLPDDYDFVQIVYTLPSSAGNRYHAGIRAAATGIGVNNIDGSAQYGSKGRLLGITVFPIPELFDCGETAFSHELGHQWINFLRNPKLAAAGPHWPPSNLATGVMGFNIPGSSVGGEFAYTVDAVSATQAHVKLRAVSTPRTFTDLDLYLMGLIPPSQVSDAIVLDGSVCDDCIVNATRITIQDVISANGPRIPSSDTSLKSFRVATIVVTRDRLLNDDEMALFDYFAARGEARVPLAYTSGFARGTTNPFFVATRGLGSVDLRLTRDEARRRIVRK